jgi:hypothetical protein
MEEDIQADSLQRKYLSKTENKYHKRDKVI